MSTSPDIGRTIRRRLVFSPESPVGSVSPVRGTGLIVPGFNPSPLRRTRQTPSPERPPFLRRSDQNSIVQQSLERLISHIYGTGHRDFTIPPILNGYHQITIPTVQNLLQNSLISRFEISTLLQPFAGPPGTPNRIILLTGFNGEKYFTVGKYDPIQNQILNPVY